MKEAIILSTCNRTEVHASLENIDEERARAHLHKWLASYRNLTLSELESTTYSYWNEEAVKHIISVAAGLDSLVLGEPQIFGQFKAAYDTAQRLSAANTDLTEVAMAAIKTVKKIRTETDIGRNSVSVAQATVIMARQIFSDLSRTKVLLLGAGETICLVSKHMQSANAQAIDIANRTLANATALAKEIGGNSMTLAEIGDRMHEYDIVISSTNSPTSVVSKDVVVEACGQRRFRPMFLVDLAVPRDIDPAVSELDNVYLYTIDDLTAVIEENMKAREDAASQALCLVDEGLSSYREDFKIRQVSRLISEFRASVDQVRDEEIEKARARLRSGEDPQKVIERLGGDLANKLAHQPTMAFKDASKADDEELIELLRNLFQSM